MKNIFILTLVSIFLKTCICYSPRECSKKDDCAPNECCVLGMDRYAIPECKPKGRIGDWCKLGAEPEDRMLYYPNQDVRHVEGVYTLFCPCEENLFCDKSKCETSENNVVPSGPFGAASSSGSFGSPGSFGSFAKAGQTQTENGAKPFPNFGKLGQLQVPQPASGPSQVFSSGSQPQAIPAADPPVAVANAGPSQAAAMG